MNFTPELKPEATLSTNQGRFFANVLRKQLASKGKLPFWSKLIDEIENQIEIWSPRMLLNGRDGIASWYGSHIPQGNIATVFADNSGVNLLSVVFDERELDSIPEQITEISRPALIAGSFSIMREIVASGDTESHEGARLVWAIYRRLDIDRAWIRDLIKRGFVPAIFLLHRGKLTLTMTSAAAVALPPELSTAMRGASHG